MGNTHQLPKSVTTILVYGRPPLVFAGMLCAIAVMWTRNPVLYILGVVFLFTSMSFDLVDGWFAARFHPNSKLAYLADRIMDKIVYSISFPLIAVGVMWRLLFVAPEYNRLELLHAIFILVLCVTVLIRDNFAQFLRSFAIKKGQEPEQTEFTRLRTTVAAPVSALLYAYAFYVPDGPPTQIYSRISWLANFPLRGLFIIEIVFLVINFGSIAGYCRKYGALCLDELCLGDERLRRSILSVFPNALTVMNAIMGLLAVFFAYQGRIREAYLLLIGAAVFDKFDGSLARKLGLTEPLPDEEKPSRFTVGGIMDDISDAVSFCIVPAWIFYIVFSECNHPFIQKLPFGWIAVLYAVMGMCRLVYFTIDTSPIPGFFKGMPTPAAALLVGAPLVSLQQAMDGPDGWVVFWGIFSFSLMIFAAIIMNAYPIRYLHMGRYMGRNPWFARTVFLVVLISMVTPFFGHISFICLAMYTLSPIFTRHIDPKVAARETKSAGY